MTQRFAPIWLFMPGDYPHGCECSTCTRPFRRGDLMIHVLLAGPKEKDGWVSCTFEPVCLSCTRRLKPIQEATQ